MIVDAHVYCLPPRLRDLLVRLPPAESAVIDAIYRHREGPEALQLASPANIMQSMEENAIDRSVLVAFPWASPALCRENSEYLAHAAERETRFSWIGSVRPGSGDCRIDARRWVDLGAIGIKINPAWQSFRMDDPEMDQLARWAADASIFLMIHVDHATRVSAASPGLFYRFVQKHPDARILATHMGGGLGIHALHPPAAAALQNVWFDTAVSSTLPMVQFYVQAGLDRKIVFGSDFPFNHSHSQGQVLEGIRALKLDGRTVKAILGENFLAMNSGADR